MENLKHYGHENIQNYSLLTQIRLQKEVSVLHKITEGSFQYLTGYDTIRKKITKKDMFENVIGLYISDENNIIIEIIFRDIYNIPLVMKFPKEYPFRPPSVKIMGERYQNLLSRFQSSGLYKGASCLCCSTLCCKHNWTPQKDMFDLIVEIYDNLNMMYEPIDECLYKKILEKHLGYYIS